MAFKDSFFNRYIKFVRIHLPALESFRHTLYVIPSAIFGYVGLKVAPKNAEIKVVPGASGIFPKGWYPLEYPFFNLLEKKSWENWLGTRKVKAVLVEHVLEHFNENAILTILDNCKQFLTPDGVIRIAVPDGFNPSEEYIEYVSPGGSGIGSETHEVLLNYITLGKLIERAGLQCRLIEYYNENGVFVKTASDPAFGKIRRDSTASERMKLPDNYTSLIVDAVKI